MCHHSQIIHFQEQAQMANALLATVKNWAYVLRDKFTSAVNLYFQGKCNPIQSRLKACFLTCLSTCLESFTCISVYMYIQIHKVELPQMCKYYIRPNTAY